MSFPAKNWTKEELTKLFMLRNEGKSIDEIAIILGRTRSSVYHRIVSKSSIRNPAKNYTTKKVPWNDEERHEVVCLMREGFTHEEISDKMNRPMGSISYIARMHAANMPESSPGLKMFEKRLERSLTRKGYVLKK